MTGASISRTVHAEHASEDVRKMPFLRKGMTKRNVQRILAHVMMRYLKNWIYRHILKLAVDYASPKYRVWTEDHDKLNMQNAVNHYLRESRIFGSLFLFSKSYFYGQGIIFIKTRTTKEKRCRDG